MNKKTLININVIFAVLYFGIPFIHLLFPDATSLGSFSVVSIIALPAIIVFDILFFVTSYFQNKNVVNNDSNQVNSVDNKKQLSPFVIFVLGFVAIGVGLFTFVFLLLHLYHV